MRSHAFYLDPRRNSELRLPQPKERAHGEDHIVWSV